MVYATLVLDATQTFLVTAQAVQEFADQFTNTVDLNNVGYTWFAIPVMSGSSKLHIYLRGLMFTNRTAAVAFIVQSIYGYRVLILSKSKFVYTIIMLVSVLSKHFNTAFHY